MQTLLIGSLSSLADLRWNRVHLHNSNTLHVPLIILPKIQFSSILNIHIHLTCYWTPLEMKKLHLWTGSFFQKMFTFNKKMQLGPLWCHKGHWGLTHVSSNPAGYCWTLCDVKPLVCLVSQNKIKQRASLKQIVFAGGCKQEAKHYSF